MSLDIEDGIELIVKAIEQKQEDMLMQRWILHYQDSISFDEFKAKLSVGPTSTDTRTEGEILAEVKEILDSFRKEKEE